MAALAMQVGSVCAPSSVPRVSCSRLKARRPAMGSKQVKWQSSASPALKLLRASKLAIGAAQQMTRSKVLTVCQAVATEAAPTTSPVKAIVVAIKLAVVNTYLNIFGRFEMGIRLLVDLVFPSKIKAIFEGLFQCYKEQVAIGNNGDMKIASQITSAVFREMIRAYAGQMLGTPYEFPSYHTAIREPIDYYKLGNDYVGTLVDYQRSVLGNAHHWDDIQKKIDNGENVIFFANHQSEADAAFIPLLTQKTHPGLGEKVVYLAGDRVVSDLMSKPFSMGRNLLCIHSKKHMAADDSATKSKKMRANIKTLKEMEKLLKAGGALLWIAPSGGRDRKSADGSLSPDRFDPDSIELMKKFGTKNGVKKTTFYPMAMATYEVMPPPVSVGGDIGEKRIVNYTGCGISLGDPIDVTENGEWAKGVAEEDQKQALTDYVYKKVSAEYSMICGCMGTGDGFETPISCSRPWL